MELEPPSLESSDESSGPRYFVPPEPVTETTEPGGPAIDSAAVSVGAPRRSRRTIAVAAGVVAVVVIVLGALLYFGVLGAQYNPFRTPKSGPTSVSFSEAYASANTSAQSQSGGPWGLVGADGLDVPAGGHNPLASGNGSTGPCSGAVPPPFVFAAASDPSNGLSPYWIFTFESLADHSDLAIVVANGAPQSLGSTPAADHCLGTGRIALLAPAASIEGSAQVAHSLANLTGFLGSFPSSTVYFLLSSQGAGLGGASGGAVWVVEATACLGSGTNPIPVAGDPFYAGGVNGTTDRVITDRSFVGLGYCEVPGTLGPTLELNASRTIYTSSGYGYVSGVIAVNSTFTPSMFHPVVLPGFLGPGAVPPPANLTFQVRNLTGSIVATFNFTSTSWTMGSGVSIQKGDSFELDSKGQIGGLALVLVSNPPLTGQIGLLLP